MVRLYPRVAVRAKFQLVQTNTPKSEIGLTREVGVEAETDNLSSEGKREPPHLPVLYSQDKTMECSLRSSIMIRLSTSILNALAN